MRAPALAAAALLALAAAPTAQAQPAGDASAPRLQPLWTLSGLSSPESVALSADGAFLYVSNVGGEGGERDANGYISRVSRDGRMLEQRWATGLDAPKGMALRDGKLFVSDIGRLVVIDAASGRIVSSHDAPDAGFLNDVALLPDGRVIVSDSGKQRIYVFDGTALTPWLEDPLLRSINGLLPEPGRLVVTTMQGRLLAVDWTSRAITVLAEGLGDGDGVARLQDGGYLVSEWPGRLFHVRPDGSHVVIQDDREAERYMNDFLLLGDVLLVPNWKPGTLSAYRLAQP